VKTTHLLLAPRVKTPEEAWRDEPVWYLDSNRGINEIGKTVQKAVAQLDPGFVGAHVPKKAHQTVPKLTNYSSRVTCITNAMAAGCSDAEVKQITGHKSDCFRGYQRPSTAACVMREHIKLGKVTDVMSPEGARQGIASSTAPPRLPAPAASAPSPPTRTPSLLDGRPWNPPPVAPRPRPHQLLHPPRRVHLQWSRLQLHGSRVHGTNDAGVHVCQWSCAPFLSNDFAWTSSSAARRPQPLRPHPPPPCKVILWIFTCCFRP